METEITMKTGRKRMWLYILGAFFALFTIYYTVMALFSSSRKISDINTAFVYKPDEKNPLDKKIFSDSVFVRLNRKKPIINQEICLPKLTQSICHLILPIVQLILK